MPRKRRGLGGIRLTITREVVRNGPPASAITTRPTTNCGKELLVPQIVAPMMNTATDACTKCRQPIRSISQRCCEIAAIATTAYTAVTRLNSSGEAPISPMIGPAPKVIMPPCRNSMPFNRKMVASSAPSRGCLGGFMSVHLGHGVARRCRRASAVGGDDALDQLVGLFQLVLEHVGAVGGALGHGVHRHRAAAVARVDRHAHRQAQLERMGGQLLG